MRSFFLVISFLLVALLAGFLLTQYSLPILMLVVVALIIFTVSFINIEWGLYILIFSMLLSPEFMTGASGRFFVGSNRNHLVCKECG